MSIHIIKVMIAECIDSILNNKTIGIVLAVLLLVSWGLQMKDTLLRNKTKKQLDSSSC